MNTHQVLKRWHGQKNYPEIAQEAARYAKQPRDEQNVLRHIEATFGTPIAFFMRDEPVEIELFGLNLIPDNAIEQMMVAARIPVATRAALMPDAHKGYALPVGGVIELDNAISPSFVGPDISCMMALSIFDMDVDEFMRDLPHFSAKLRENTRFGKGAKFDKPREHYFMEEDCWDETQLLRSLKPLMREQLGTSGGGNHFADLMILRRDGKQYPALLTHSGSRGPGAKVAAHYMKLARNEMDRFVNDIPNGYKWFDLDSELGQEYLNAMTYMGWYALMNHNVIHNSFIEATGLYCTERIHNRHNFAWVDKDNKVIHRKGATPAHMGELGIIPGTSGSLSYLVEGLGNPNSLRSASHGAGRHYSRTEARKRHNPVHFEAFMDVMGVSYDGIAPDETVLAYKDIDRVISAQEGTLLNVVGTMQPVYVIMGGEDDASE